jgi:chemotaxis protein MotB
MRIAFVSTAVLICVAVFSGCVSKASYDQQLDETIRLAGTVQALEKEYLQQQEENTALAERNDDLGRKLSAAMNANSGLQQDLVRARADLDRLETVLSARSAEAGSAMAEMRQTIDRLEEQNRQVEQERLAREARIARMKSTYDELVDKMESEITRGEVTISELQGKLTVNMVERILFDTGKAEIKPAGREVLRRVGEILKGTEDKEIQIEGHTDNVPISPRLQQTFPSNWELSTARATTVVHFLQEKTGIPGEKLAAAGYGEFRPIANNSTARGRALNRRIQIILVPAEARMIKPIE